MLIKARSKQTWLVLPMPDCMPADGVTECRWMSITHMRPLEHEIPPSGILTNRPQVAILLMRSAKPEAPDMTK